MIPIESRIAERRFTVVDDPGRSVTVTIGLPRQEPTGDWACPYYIDGIPMPPSDKGFGVDSVSALLTALHGIRYALEAAGVRVSWEGGEPGDTGFPKLMHYAFGFAFSQKIERHIDDEVEKLVAEKQTRGGGGSSG